VFLDIVGVGGCLVVVGWRGVRGCVFLWCFFGVGVVWGVLFVLFWGVFVWLCPGLNILLMCVRCFLLWFCGVGCVVGACGGFLCCGVGCRVFGVCFLGGVFVVVQ